MAEITDVLASSRGGDANAVATLTPLVYERLRELAHRQLRREGSRRTLDTTALVHEVYVDLLQRDHMPAADRSHFFAYAATAMRHILVDEARRRVAEKRGGTWMQMQLDHLDSEGAAFSLNSEAHSVVAIDQAMTKLAAQSPRLVQIIEMRFFSGMSVEDTAAALDLDPRSVVRDWKKARLYMHEALGVD